MCKCVRGSLEEPGGAAWGQRGGSVGAAGEPRGATAGTPCGHLYGNLIILMLEPFSELAIRELPEQSTLIAVVLDPYMGPMWILYGSYVDPYMDPIWIPIWILYRSFYGS